MKKSPLTLKSLEIKRSWSSPYNLEGKVQFNGENSDVTMKITEEQAKKIMDMCAEGLLEVAKQQAEVLRCDIIESVSVEKRIGK